MLVYVLIYLIKIRKIIDIIKNNTLIINNITNKQQGIV